ncbi:DUF2790 domain-containing protein [Pseudomonas sp. SDO528_S397]
MKIKSALLLCALSAFTLAAQANTPSPDIHQVVSISEDASSGPLCSIVNSHLTYLDAQGQSHVLDYRKFASNCLEGS